MWPVWKGLQKAKLDEKDAQNRKTEFENRIKLFMGDATAIKGVCTWKNNKDSVKTDWEQVASVALASMSAEDQKKLIQETLKKHNGKRSIAAKDLRISERTLYHKIKTYGLE